ncbi:uncharacterized protein LOC128955903 [Oppia nitens]|uniref:uncharacterized protein LOC128955903 n=1 Tax=Oppia nitens TaxID=1686743 RepID=UPI0023DB0F95|nr:uncharacterized protein LOC128955903 [Oppia nitens]
MSISLMGQLGGNNGIKEVRILYSDQQTADQKQTFPLIRGRPMFAEVEFIPSYIPQLTYYMAVSVIMPKQIRSTGADGPWVLGYHQEPFTVPLCRLCTNRNQSYTMPVTIFLPDDGWCAQGPVPTGWKVEAIPQNPKDSDNTDMIIGMSIDERAHIVIANANTSTRCRNINEYINYTIPVVF